MGELKAEHLVAALRERDVKLQCSALWATTRLSAGELAKLEPTLSGMKVRPDAAPYLARALGPLGTEKAFERLASLLQTDGKEPFVKEAVVSGLDQHEIEFRDGPMKDTKDKDFLALLERGAKDKQAVSAGGGSSLTGEALASFQRGKGMFLGEAACFGCHGAAGDGMPNLGPPLEESQWVTGKPETLVKILLHGMTGPVEVDGETYAPTADMPGLGTNPNMTDQTLADIATYIRNEWENKAGPVAADLVKKERELTKSRTGKAWTAVELGK